MKLNPDCIRDLLLEIEQTTDYQKIYSYSPNDKFLKKYDKNTIYYHFRQASLNNFFINPEFDMSGQFYCVDLSPKGHQFLNDIRSENNWRKTKTIAHKVGSLSLETLSTIATGVVTNLINTNLTP